MKHVPTATSTAQPSFLARWTGLALLAATGLLSARAQVGNPVGDPPYPVAESLQIGRNDTTYAVPTSGAVYYVAPAERGVGNADYPAGPLGAAANAGTEAAPWTIQKALADAPAGATLVCRGGTYRTGNLRVEKRLTIQPRGNEKVWFKGSQVVTGWAQEGSLWVKTGWTYKFKRPSKTKGIGPKHIDDVAHPEADLLDQVFFNGQPLEQRLTKGLVTATRQFYVDTIHQKLYLFDNPGAAKVEATAYGLGFLAFKGTRDEVRYDGSNAVVQGIGVAHYASFGLNLQAPRVAVRHCTVVWSGFAGIGVFNNSPNLVVAGNRIWYNGSNGITGSLVDFSSFARNHIAYNNFYQFETGWNAGGLKLGDSEGLVYKNNLVEDNNGIGLWMDVSCYNATIAGNVCRRNAAGIVFELSHNAIIAGNVVVGPGGGILIEDATAAKVYNNTLVGCTKGIFVADGDRGDVAFQNTKPADERQLPSATGRALGITWETKNTVVKNNIISNAGGPSVDMDFFIGGRCDRYAAKPDSMVAAMNHNVYFRLSSQSQTAPLIQWLNRNKATANKTACQRAFATLAAFRSAIKFDQQGVQVPAAAANPLFVDADGGDYHLAANSPARGAGEALPANVADVLGWPAGVPVDAGAYRAAAVPKTAQTITWGQALPALTFAPGLSVTLAATAPGGPVAFALGGGSPATLTGNTLAITGAGTVTVTATQGGNATYLPAAAVTRSFVVGKATPTLAFPALADVAYAAGATVALTATVSNGEAVSYAVAGPATLSGSTLTLTGVGRVTVTASLPASANYNAAAPVERDFVATGLALALNAGGAAYTSAAGVQYQPEGSLVSGGTALDRPTRAIANTTDDRLYQSERWGDFSYTLPVENGTYEVTLQLAELYYETNGTGQRLYDVLAEGGVKYDNLDVFAAAGGANRALDRTFAVAVADGVLNLQFRSEAGKNNAQVCGLVVRRVSDGAATGARQAPAPAPAAASAAAALPTPAVAGEPLSAFPNPSPAGQQPTVTWRAQAAQRVTLRVYDRQQGGRFVGLYTLAVPAGEHAFRLPVALPQGTYVLKADLDGQAQSFTLQVE